MSLEYVVAQRNWFHDLPVGFPFLLTLRTFCQCFAALLLRIFIDPLLQIATDIRFETIDGSSWSIPESPRQKVRKVSFLSRNSFFKKRK